MKVAHLPFYNDNPYQELLMQAQQKLAWETIEGGGGGNFLRSALFRWNADAFHFHWLHPYIVRPTSWGTRGRGIQFIIELAMLRLRGKRLIWTMHNLHSHDTSLEKLELFFRRWAAMFFHRIICHSEYSANLACDILKIPRQKIQVSEHPNFIEQYPNQISQPKARDQLGLKHKANVFLFLGRIAAYKGLEKLISSFENLEDKNSILVIAGKPQSESFGERIKKLCSNSSRIQLALDRIPTQDIQIYMNAADVVVFPFENILTSGSVVMAMGFGKPIIAAARGGLPEILPNTPLLYKDDLDSSLKWSVDNWDKLPPIGRQNLERTKSWTWTQLAKDCLESC
jgi:glycosyltransferase involved in cell wall biosynthesis